MTSGYTDIGKYQRIERLGGGYFGDVYRVYDRALDTQRALKVIPEDPSHPRDIELWEAQLLEVCKHKHIVEVKEADLADVDGIPSVIIACELMPRGSVDDLLENNFISVYSSADIITQALFGLAHLHAAGILHCDLKPGNLLIGDSGVIKLSDFGLAVSCGDTPDHFYTMHKAPELILGEAPSELTDVYAAGVTLFRLLNGVYDIAAILPTNFNEAITRGRFPDRSAYLPHIPERVKRICNRAMHIDKTKRFQSADGFRQALEGLPWSIDWHKISDTEWHGIKSDVQYTIEVFEKRTGWCLDFKRNNRRIIDYCGSRLPSEMDAVSALYEMIRTTTLS